MRLIKRLDGASEGRCDQCRALLGRVPGQGDIECHRCGAFYNCFGQRLRDDLRSRPNVSEVDDEVDDLTGDELSYIGREKQ